MSSALYSRLEWLPRPPENFARLCRTILDSRDDLGTRIRALANHGLDAEDANKLAKVIDRARSEGHSLAPLTPFRLGIVSNATARLLPPVLTATAARHGIALECIEVDFGQTVQAALDPESPINRAGVDAVLVAIDHRGLPLRSSPGDRQAHEATIAACLRQLETIRAGFRAHSNAFCIIQTIAPPVEALTGSFESVLSGTTRSLVDAFNRALVASMAETPDSLLDVAALAACVGTSEWHDPIYWNLAKLPFSSNFLPLYAEHVCRLIAAQRGKSRRCLVLDLDNTLWGGLIGDDGLDGITIGPGDPSGEAFLEIQRTALALRERGILLAVSSKNSDEIARRPLREHPEMLLREEHLALFQANWNDKATNIAAIARELSLGLDALVFLDDNPAERALVRRMLPQVAVPELPANPALYSRYLLAAGYFEAVACSAEDRARADLYRDNARRVALQQQIGDHASYLASLAMTITFGPFDDTGRVRIAQLINKSNQFNLTTRRYGEEDVREAQYAPDCFTLQARLSDIFGDNGMISVVICRRVTDEWHIDTWLMSCRVLGRKVEQAVLQEILFQAREHGIHRLVGTYHPTERNRLVADHYATLGFEQQATEPDGTTHWWLAVASAPAETLPMTVRRRWDDA